LWRTLLTALTVLASVVCILITLLPARPFATKGHLDAQGPQEGAREPAWIFRCETRPGRA
jgi:hypothetical protein